jgi:hypothetical protein
VAAVVEKFCQYPGSPARAGFCEADKAKCPGCQYCVLRLRPEIAQLLRKEKGGETK